MIRPGVVACVARAEARLTRRLVRYWVFLVLALALGAAGYVYYAALHGLFSSFSATISAIGPRYLPGVVGPNYLLVLTVGLIFLGFDVRARDQRERIVEVLDARPISNPELLLGRFLGVFLLCWLPAAALLVVLQVVGWMGGKLGWVLGPMEPKSLVAFQVFQAIPALAFMLALVFLVSLLVRHRLVAALVLFVFLVGDYWATLRQPLYLAPLLDLTGGYQLDFPSDILGWPIDLLGVIQRSAVLIAAAGALVLAAAVHPRQDEGSRAARGAMGLALVAIGFAMAGGVCWRFTRDLKQLDRWREAHGARGEAAVPDLQSVSGQARIVPGRSLELDLELGFRAPEGRSLETALFTFNPGLAVRRVSDRGGREIPFTHRDGLLELELRPPLASGETMAAAIAASGRPDDRFAYIDAPRQILELTPWQAQLALLGVRPLIFHPRHVALMPGARWLPTPGSETGRDDPRARPADFFELDLTVELPRGFLAAGPGPREEGRGGAEGAVRYRFHPPAPLPEVALVAGRYESRVAEIEGVRFELLLHPAHVANLAVFEDAAREIQNWVGERLREAADLGLPYPYGAFTLVEVPTTLRGFGGGWRMGTTFAPPAMMLLRESGFPAARFDFAFRRPGRFQDQEGGVARAKRERLASFFENDFTGGNVFLGIAPSFFTYQTRPAGPEALALDYVCEALVADLVTEQEGYFSAHLFTPELNQLIGNVISNYLGTRGQGKDLAQTVIDIATSRPEVWDAVLGVDLSRLDPRDSPRRALDVLALKGGAMARSLKDGLGREVAGRLLGALRAGRSGTTFDVEHLVAAGRELGHDLGPTLDVWLRQTLLPGFVVEQPRVSRLPDDGGSARYQIRFTLRNDEPAAGLFVVETRTGGENDRRTEASEPFQVAGRSAVEVGLIRRQAPAELNVMPYLSLNRGQFTVPVPAVDEDRILREEPFKGIRPAAWRSTTSDIVVDDLDPGFTVEESQEKPWWRLGARSADVETDQGLPVVQPGAGRLPSRWSRLAVPRAWGKYRHTVAMVRGGTGSRRAVFKASVPGPGSWNLELHLPAREGGRRGVMRRDRGTWRFSVEDGAGSKQATFDADAAEEGWNPLGSFELAGGEVRVFLSNSTEGQVVIADAIRWVAPKNSSSKG
jgi:hypothetical protein